MSKSETRALIAYLCTVHPVTRIETGKRTHTFSGKPIPLTPAQIGEMERAHYGNVR